MRCIYESLAMKYRYTYEQLKDCTGKDYRAIHMIGGGTKDSLLCQMTANACGCTVTAGPHRSHGSRQYRHAADC